jgi:hypothetical protein
MSINKKPSRRTIWLNGCIRNNDYIIKSIILYQEDILPPLTSPYTYKSPIMRTSINRLIRTQPSGLRSITTTSRHASPPRPPPKIDRPQPTVFSNKSSPQQIHDRPEMIRGMPAGSTPSWAKGGGSVPKYVKTEKGDDFAGPSKPRLVYERPGERELPSLKVRLLDGSYLGSR